MGLKRGWDPIFTVKTKKRGPRRVKNRGPAPLLALGAAAEPLHGVLQELAVGRQPELVLDGLAVGLDRLHRQREFLRDLARAHAAADHVEDLDFAVRETRHRIVGFRAAFAGALIEGTLYGLA